MFIQLYVSCVTCLVSHVTCHMSRVMCHLSCVKCHLSKLKKNIKKNIYNFFFFKPLKTNWTTWWSYSVEGMLSMGPTLSSLHKFVIEIDSYAQKVKGKMFCICKKKYPSCRTWTFSTGVHLNRLSAVTYWNTIILFWKSNVKQLLQYHSVIKKYLVGKLYYCGWGRKLISNWIQLLFVATRS